MDNQIYSYQVQNGRLHTSMENSDQDTLKEVLKKAGDISYENIINGYCTDLNLIIESNELGEMAKKVSELSHYVEKLNDEWEFSEDVQLPNFKSIFETLSPLFLSSVDMNYSNGQYDYNEIHKKWIESIRAVIEDELYFWKEKLINNQKVY